MTRSGCIWKKKEKFLTWGWGFHLNEKGIIFKLIFELGCPVFVIARTLGTSEVEVYRYLTGKSLSRKANFKLKMLWMDLMDMDENQNSANNLTV